SAAASKTSHTTGCAPIDVSSSRLLPDLVMPATVCPAAISNGSSLIPITPVAPARKIRSGAGGTGACRVSYPSGSAWRSFACCDISCVPVRVPLFCLITKVTAASDERSESTGGDRLVPVDAIPVRPADHLLRLQERPACERHQQRHERRRDRTHRLLVVGLGGLGDNLLDALPPQPLERGERRADVGQIA